MKLYKIATVQYVNAKVEDCWDFFSSPKNLQTITLDNMNFEIKDFDEKRMYHGQIITYTLRPLLGIKISWVTEITACKENHYFIDVQRFGPYKLWHHKHFFERTIDGGTKMTDIVHYALPLGILGRIMNRLVVKNKLKTIFDFRYNKIEELFNSKSQPKIIQINSEQKSI